ncbi:MAG: hypothetical protein M3220_10515 [Chloroflexota bacterium]|nr:hypothetical protein [Chloroflexota bacterium]
MLRRSSPALGGSRGVEVCEETGLGGRPSLYPKTESQGVLARRHEAIKTLLSQLRELLEQLADLLMREEVADQAMLARILGSDSR